MDFWPEAVRKGFEAARARSGRLSFHDGDTVHRILRMWDDGCAVAATDAAPLHGLVDLYDGPRHLAVVLIVAGDDAEGGERHYSFKRKTPVRDVPPADYERPDAPSVFLPGPGATA